MAGVIQVGIKILRTPDGACEKAVALYALATPELAAREAAMLNDLEALTAKATHDYIEARKAVKRQSRQNKEE